MSPLKEIVDVLWCRISYSISSGAQYVTLQKNKYFTSNLSYIKLKLGQQIGGGTSNSKPLGPIIMMSQSETLSSSEILFITLFSAGAHSCCCWLSPANGKLWNYAKPKPFC
jgi:hypothetical protein